MKRVLPIVALILALTGCALGMSYHPWDSTWNLGYTETQLSPTVYRVTYAGHSIPQNQCDDYALLRAAELTQGRGYKYFRIVGEQKSSQAKSFYLPGATLTNATVSGAHLNAVSYSTGSFMSVNRPVSTFEIEMTHSASGSTDGLIDAEITGASIREKHKIVLRMN